MPHSWRRALRRARGGSLSKGRLVTSHICVGLGAPCTVRILSKRATWEAASMPSSAGSMERVTKLRRSSRPRFFSSVQAVRWAWDCLSGGEKRTRHEGLGGFVQCGLVVFKSEEVVGARAQHGLCAGFMLGVQGIQADEPADQIGPS